uniref:Uncharacterized protein n=1 Tax=Rhizophora mucronata TaxID=61149 RepID=A0A2P2QIR3_RHIMU
MLLSTPPGTYHGFSTIWLKLPFQYHVRCKTNGD